MTKRVIAPHKNESLAAVGTATLKIAHEIGNSLNIMTTSLQVMQLLFKEQHQAIDDCAISILCDMTSEVERMKELLAELRDVSRPAKVNIEPVHLQEVVTAIVCHGRLAIRPKAIAVEHQIPDDLPPVLADKEKLARVLLNLCVNALEAMPNGGKLALRAYKADERVCVEIQDTGVGIPKHFDPFRPFNTTKEKGWGLGLAVVSQIVQALNGTLSYESRRGEGTTFRLHLPAALARPGLR
jgi:two-component system sensor histidine kinase HydH